MKTKQLFNLSLILIVISAGVAYKQMQKPKELATQEYIPLNLTFDSTQVAAMDIIKPQGKEEQYIEILKSGSESWNLKSFLNARADKAKIDEFLKELKDAKGEIRAKSKKVFKDFMIDDEQAVQIVLKDAGQKALLDVRLGLKKAERNLFIRKSGSDEIYITSADLYGKMGIYGDPQTEIVNNNFWASTELVSFQSDKVESLQIKHGLGNQAVIYSGVERRVSAQDPAKKIWSFLRDGMPFAPDEAKIKAFLDSFKTWRASRVIEKTANQDYGFEKSEWEMTLRLEGGQTFVVKTGSTNQESKTTYMQVSSESVVFELSPYFVENLDASDTRFFADNPLGVDLAKTVKLVVNADKQKWEVNPKEKTWPELTQYLDELKMMTFTRVLSQAAELKKVKSPGKYWVEITNEGAAAPVILDFGDVIQEAPKEYGVIVRGGKFAFAVSETTRKNIFENTSRLEAPKETKPVVSDKA